MNPRRWISTCLAALSLAACASLNDSDTLKSRVLQPPSQQAAHSKEKGASALLDTCTHSTPQPPTAATAWTPGTGGTGAPAERSSIDPGGIGGTGQVAEGGLGGTGIVGVVTGFGSICVNGMKIEYAPDTPVWLDGRSVPQSALAIGQVVAMQAITQGARLQAQRIAVLDAAVGPLDDVDSASGHFTVMGQSATALVPEDLQGLRPGQWVRVSGQRLADGQIRATRVQATRPGLAWVVGALGRRPDGGPSVGDTPLAAGGAPLPTGAEPGQELAVSGQWIDQRLLPSHITLRPTHAALGSMESVLMQGYLHGVNSREVTLGFATLKLDRAPQVLGGQIDSLHSGQPVLVRARRDEQQGLVIDRLEIRHEGGRGGSRSDHGATSSRESGTRSEEHDDDKGSGRSDSDNKSSSKSESSNKSSGSSDRSANSRSSSHSKQGDR
jgi:hypothetical protein